MNSYLIGYDLNKAGQDYESLIDQIKKIGTWWHCLDSTWIVKSNLTAVEIRDALKEYIDDNDELLVIKLSREAAWTGFSDECSNWLKDNL
ncbi:CRISPR-associated protein Cas2 [Marinifilum fragile]|uniref:CRISPR-associated protein Cas2 n=1 Tax=Marinifilum fragile TaxID=570161 RepID=UPI002AA7716E|nr:CRISPR-associated protein Cas2 [Marinifilum fragile]